ncbi:Fe(3+) ABC transporter substrate-binding protein [Ramlibacter solisilvae]|uniref:Iron deficiency-induced protein A n=1 Tax=Ramlibacter tataouinensis TaxID=94132 RepID=A0A127JUE2_9BURK|nr:Fe(3+) ABC transporter substrate-binding protein [Ramlibacter tataouinensis]AMO23535.1 iron deficiency-induced protein A [Ramlibacter tataouinensis]
MKTTLRLAVLALAAAALPALAQDKELNLYSARHYQTDEALYANFTKATGIKINRIEAGDEALLERLANEGANSPADVVLLVDAARLAKAQQAGLFQPVQSAELNAKIPANLRAPDGSWYAFSTRARVIVYNKVAVKAADVDTYEELADPKNKGKVCTRSGAHPYQLSLAASMIEHLGEAKAEEWAKGVVANMARPPRGGDTDQIMAVASGECGVALSNSYYVARLMRSTKPEDKEAIAKVGVLWPNQADRGTHINISGGAVAKSAKNRDNAVKFLEYLASDQAQAYFANGNNEWPVVKSAAVKNPALEQLGDFKADPMPVSALLKNAAAAQKMMDRAGYK